MTAFRPSALFRHIETLQGGRPWGAVLDAGTGAHSIRWISGLETTRWTAVTGSAQESDVVSRAIGALKRAEDRVVVGNWADSKLLEGETYDTVVADYLLGAVEGFAPFFQPYLFRRLRALTGQTIYVTGLEPYVPTRRPDDEAGRLIWEIGRLRDACVLLKGGLPYREYPAAWVGDHLRRSGFATRSLRHFRIGYKEPFVNAQIDIATAGLDRIEDTTLARALGDRGERLREKALLFIEGNGALRSCRNYVISAEPEGRGDAPPGDASEG